MPEKKRIAIVGATGFTGSELVRILRNHPDVEIAMITSESRAGERFSDVHPFFEGIMDMELRKAADLMEVEIDLAFLALPHGVSMDYVRQFANKPFRIVDLSGDFRLNEPSTYEEWYNKKHIFKEGFKDAVYGMPELFASEIANARIVANPGCFPTGAILGLSPLVKEGIIDPGNIIVDSKTGVTGAGVKSKPVNHYSNVNENFKAYGVKTHRHSIEIQEKLDGQTDGDVCIQFTPHLLPVDRGILSTIYAKPVNDQVDDNSLQELYRTHYGSEPFIRLLSRVPEIKHVRGTNFCDIYTTFDERTGNIIVVTAIDNLVKGAAGQAVHNMNIMLGLEATSGLNQIPLNP